jgi:hypothetical protein
MSKLFAKGALPPRDFVAHPHGADCKVFGRSWSAPQPCRNRCAIVFRHPHSGSRSFTSVLSNMSGGVL